MTLRVPRTRNWKVFFYFFFRWLVSRIITTLLDAELFKHDAYKLIIITERAANPVVAIFKRFFFRVSHIQYSALVVYSCCLLLVSCPLSQHEYSWANWGNKTISSCECEREMGFILILYDLFEKAREGLNGREVDDNRRSILINFTLACERECRST